MMKTVLRMTFGVLCSLGAGSCSKNESEQIESKDLKPKTQRNEDFPEAPMIKKAKPARNPSSSPDVSKGEAHKHIPPVATPKILGTPEHPMPAKRGEFFIYTRGEKGPVSGKLWYEAFYFRPEGYAVAWGDRGFMLIDRDEKEIGAVYLIDNYPDSVQDGVIRMQEGEKMRYFSLREARYLKGAWDHASPFDNGIACVCNDCVKPHGEYHIVEGGKSWFINDKGKILRPYTNPTPQCALGHRKETQAWQSFVDTK